MEGRLEHDMKIQKASKNKLVSMPECVSEYYDFMKASSGDISESEFRIPFL